MYQKTIEELEKQAVLWWPEDLKKEAAKISVVPILLDTQDKLISLLNLYCSSPYQIFNLIKSSNFPANLFLKHLMILTDYGGENIQRLNKNFSEIFEKTEDGKNYFMKSYFKDGEFNYTFVGLPIRGKLDNKKLKVDGQSIFKNNSTLDNITKDMIMILLYGANATNVSGADLSKCDLSNFICNKEKLNHYIKHKYIWVSRIIAGAESNSQGQIAQTIIYNYLRENLYSNYTVKFNSSIFIPGYSTESEMPFDIVVEKDSYNIGIEVSFQVTSNSIIERKAGQAQDRYKNMHNNNNYIAYVIDGAGNFQRKSAISTICNYSDCTIAFSREEFENLLNFIKEKL